GWRMARKARRGRRNEPKKQNVPKRQSERNGKSGASNVRCGRGLKRSNSFAVTGGSCRGSQAGRKLRAGKTRRWNETKSRVQSAEYRVRNEDHETSDKRTPTTSECPMPNSQVQKNDQ